MALNINGRMKVKTLKADFRKEFGLNIRLYDGREFADDDATLASIRKGDSTGGEFAPQRNTKVGNLEDKIMDLFGLKTQVSGSDDSYLCENDHTLAKALEVDEKLMVKRENREAKAENAEIDTSEQEEKAKDYNLLLIQAAGDNDIELAQKCIDNGADVSFKVDDGSRSSEYTPLMSAAWNNSEDVAELLLENGAGNTITENEDKRTGDNAIDIARERGYEDLSDTIASYW